MLASNWAKFIDNDLPTLLLENDQFKGQKLIKWKVKESQTDFGFMSTIMDGLLTITDHDKK